MAWASHDLISDLSADVADGACAFPVTPAPPASYDEQLFLVEGGGSVNLTFDVTAVAQTDVSGYGPAYLVNGLTSAGGWYQVGLSYDWPCGSGFASGFHYFAEVWSADGRSVSGPVDLPLLVHPGDDVALGLSLAGPNVVLSATDPSTGSRQSTSAPADGVTGFAGGLDTDGGEPGWFTGVMTEWYHTQPYYGSEQTVLYTAITPITGLGTGTVTLGIDEQVVSGGPLFAQTHPVDLTCPCNSSFAYDGATEEVSPTTFSTGS